MTIRRRPPLDLPRRGGRDLLGNLYRRRGEPSPPETEEDMSRQESFEVAAAYSDAFVGSVVICQLCNKIAFEHYASGSASTPHQLASGTKMMNIALHALAVADGLWTLTEKVSDTITEWQGVTQFEDITIENLLAQNGGIVDSGSYSAHDSSRHRYL